VVLWRSSHCPKLRGCNALTFAWAWKKQLGSLTMGYQSSDNDVFQAQVARWITEHLEVLAMIRFSCMGGAKSFEFFDNFKSFKSRLKQLPPRICVIVFALPQLPLRGRVDDDFIKQALSLVPNGTEFLIAGLELVVCGKAAWYEDSAGETHDELRESLQDMLGPHDGFARHKALPVDHLAVAG
jgi:hypothetical protein